MLVLLVVAGMLALAAMVVPLAGSHRALRADPPAEPRPRWITLRSALLGSAAVCLVNGLAPYNDFVVANTFIIGSYLPLILVMTFFVLIVLVNGPLSRFAPRYAISSGELAVIMAMMLVSCAIPTQGLMRYFLPMLVGPFNEGRANETFRKTFEATGLPAWLFPLPQSEGSTSPIVTCFYSRLQEGDPVPYGAWIKPLAGWGVFIGAMLAMLMAMASIVRYQWAVNERLPFPIAQIELALIQSPQRGRMFNATIGSRAFWIGFGAVFLLQGIVGLKSYFPVYVPKLTLGYDLSDVMTETPWTYLAMAVKKARIYFTFIGIAYFIQSRAAFSLWAIFLFERGLAMFLSDAGAELPGVAWQDQHMGACVAFVLGTLWIGRHHLGRVLKLAVWRGGDPEQQRDFLSYRWAVYVLVGGMAVMLGWLILVGGVQWWFALLIVAFIVLGHMVVARVVAETGLPFVRSYAHLSQVYNNLAPASITANDLYFGGVFTSIGPIATRESLTTYTLHAQQVADGTGMPPRSRRPMMFLLAWAVLLGVVVASWSSLWCYYRYATPLAQTNATAINPYGSIDRVRQEVVDPITRWANKQTAIRKHSTAMHFGIGFVVLLALQAFTLRWASWPLLPVGFLLAPTWYAEECWFSILLGWIVKVAIVKFGGAKLYQQARPFFIGLIFGEAMAAGTWLIVALVLAQMGYDYKIVNLLPS